MPLLPLICTAVLGLLLFGLGLAVSLLRFREKTLTGSSADPANPLHRVLRAHGNTAEYAPFLAALLLYAALKGPGTALADALAVGATASRVLIVVGLVAWPLDRPNPLRFVGALGTYLFGLALSLALLAGA